MKLKRDSWLYKILYSDIYKGEATNMCQLFWQCVFVPFILLLLLFVVVTVVTVWCAVMGTVAYDIDKEETIQVPKFLGIRLLPVLATYPAIVGINYLLCTPDNAFQNSIITTLVVAVIFFVAVINMAEPASSNKKYYKPNLIKTWWRDYRDHVCTKVEWE